MSDVQHERVRTPAYATLPTLGLDVHYVSYGTPGGEYSSTCRTAQVTEAGAWVRERVTDHGDGTRTVLERYDPNGAQLLVANPTGLFLNGPMCHDPRGAPGTWHRPEECPHHA